MIVLMVDGQRLRTREQDIETVTEKMRMENCVEIIPEMLRKQG